MEVPGSAAQSWGHAEFATALPRNGKPVSGVLCSALAWGWMKGPAPQQAIAIAHSLSLVAESAAEREKESDSFSWELFERSVKVSAHCQALRRQDAFC